MGRQHADEGDAGGANESARDAQLERKRGAAADDGTVVEGGVDPIYREQLPHPLDEVRIGRPPEVVEDRRDRARVFLGHSRPNLDGQTRSSGA
jgi:hypothetical protein